MHVKGIRTRIMSVQLLFLSYYSEYSTACHNDAIYTSQNILLYWLYLNIVIPYNRGNLR